MPEHAFGNRGKGWRAPTSAALADMTSVDVDCRAEPAALPDDRMYGNGRRWEPRPTGGVRVVNRDHRSHSFRPTVTVRGALLLAVMAIAPSTYAQVPPGHIVVMDSDAEPAPSTNNLGVLFGVDPSTGVRAVLTDFNLPPLTGGIDPRWIAIERDGSILAVDHTAGTNGLGALLRIDPTGGPAALVSDFGSGGQGPLGAEPWGVAVEADGQILVMDIGGQGTTRPPRLFRINPFTGLRTVLSDFSTGVNTGFGSSIAVEADGSILVLNQVGIVSLLRVDPTTGTRTVVSNLNEGANPAPGPRGIAVEPTGTILLTEIVSGPTGAGALFRIDPVTGARTRVSDYGNVAQGPLATDSMQVAVGATGEIYVSNLTRGTLGAGAVFQVDPVTGQRVLLSDFGNLSQGAVGLHPFGILVVPPPPGTLVVIKSVVNNNGGVGAVSDWAMTVTGGRPDPATFSGASQPGIAVQVDPGPYAVSETGPVGYANLASAECSGTIASGETRTCTMTSDDLSGTLVVAKAVVNDHGGTRTSGDWTFTVTGASPSPAVFAGAPLPGTTVIIDPGSYAVTEVGPTGYTTVVPIDCAGTIGFGETKTCVSTSDDLPPVALTVSKTGSGTGLVTSTPGGIACGADCDELYVFGTPVTLSAVADSGSTFAGWSGDPDCADGIVTMTTSLSCVATFTASAVADLVVSALSVPGAGNLTRGAAITLNSTTTNLSMVATTAVSRTAFYFSVNATLDTADIPLGSVIVPGLAPGASASATTQATVPTGVPIGNWFVLAVADGDTVVAETNEANNVASKGVKIRR